MSQPSTDLFRTTLVPVGLGQPVTPLVGNAQSDLGVPSIWREMLGLGSTHCSLWLRSLSRLPSLFKLSWLLLGS
jgi:hypothetical protein